MFTAPPIMGVTINNVPLPSSFRAFVYLFIIVLGVAITVYFLLNGARPGHALKKAALITFFSSGVLYAVQSDYLWSTWLVTDAAAFRGLSTNDKLVRLEGGIVDFAQQVNKTIDGDYMLFSSQDYLALRLEYFLLPKRKRQEAKYLVVAADQQSNYDQKSRVFTRGELKIGPVEPVLLYARNAYVLKRVAP